MFRQDFWNEVFQVTGSVTPYVMLRVMVFVAIGAVVYVVDRITGMETGLVVAPYEIIGVVLALLLVLRTNAGYDRWYEARKLWGSIVNQTRNLATIGAVYGPRDPQWQDDFTRWAAAFPHACRHLLRGETDYKDLEHFLGPERVAQLAAAQHGPMFVACKLATLLRKAMNREQIDRFAFLQAEHERASLIDHIGGCERILKTPLARVFSIKIRRFIFLYLIALPIAIVDKTGLSTPLIVLVVAYPLLSLDQIGVELQNPFSRDRLSHLPIDEIAKNIEANVFDAQNLAANDDPEVDVVEPFVSHYSGRTERVEITPVVTQARRA